MTKYNVSGGFAMPAQVIDRIISVATCENRGIATNRGIVIILHSNKPFFRKG